MSQLARVALVALALGALAALPSRAADNYLGTIVVTDAGAVHNLFPTDGGAFAIPPNVLLMLQPSAAAHVCVEAITDAGAPTCSATMGVKLATDEKFPSSCKPKRSVLMADGGVVQSCVVTVKPSGAASVNLGVFTRDGTEGR